MHEPEEKLKIKFLALDVDGVLTDGGMYYSNSGDEFKKFNTKDGLGIKRLIANGVKVGFLSNGINDSLINNRAKLLGVEYVYVGVKNKAEVLEEWRKELQIEYADFAYIGDDVNDAEVVDIVGFSACPNDAVESIKQKVNHILKTKGGEGCVREFIDTFLN
jgi:3-deoxy-D-manno-octulosonate 8-phosphate phosphatase (KDO 8-P phosphatase)